MKEGSWATSSTSTATPSTPTMKLFGMSRLGVTPIDNEPDPRSVFDPRAVAEVLPQLYS